MFVENVPETELRLALLMNGEAFFNYDSWFSPLTDSADGIDVRKQQLVGFVGAFDESWHKSLFEIAHDNNWILDVANVGDASAVVAVDFVSRHDD